jgi:uncharacterized protein YjiS (DUF1127 family)
MASTFKSSRVDLDPSRPLTSRPHVLSDWRHRARTRAQLARMSEAELKDIGLTHTDAWAEIQKPCWRR